MDTKLRTRKPVFLANGDLAFHYAQLISNWTKDLTVFTNGKSTLSPEQKAKIASHNIAIIEKEIASLNHSDGYVDEIVFNDHSTFSLKAIYAGPAFEQHCKIPEALGCALTESGHLQVNTLQQTSVEGIYACGDNCSPFRSVSNAVAAGSMAAGMLNKELIEEVF